MCLEQYQLCGVGEKTPNRVLLNVLAVGFKIQAVAEDKKNSNKNMGVLQMANVQTVDTGRKKILYLKNV